MGRQRQTLFLLALLLLSAGFSEVQVSLVNPSNNSVWSYGNPVLFTYQVSSPEEIAHCNLTIEQGRPGNLCHKDWGTVSSSGDTAPGPAGNAFDNNLLTFWEYHFTMPQWISYDFGEGNSTRVEKYSLGCGTWADRMPRNWLFQGSNDGSEWTTLDSRTGETGWSNNEFRNYSISSPGTYRHYRLYVEQVQSGDIIRLGELQMFEHHALFSNSSSSVERDTPQTMSKSLADGEYRWEVECTDEFGTSNTSQSNLLTIPAGFSEVQVSLVNPSNNSVWSYGNPVLFTYQVSSPEEIAHCNLTIEQGRPGNLCHKDWGTVSSSGDTAWGPAGNAFDNNLFTFWEYWEYNSPMPQWISYDFGEGNSTRVEKYSLGCGPHGSDDTGRMPRNWLFQGSNDGSEWTTLDSRTGETGWSNNEFRNYSISSPGTYRHYRLYVEQVQSGDIIRLGELQMFEHHALFSNSSSSVERDTPQTMSKSLADGEYRWEVECTDEFGTSNTSQSNLLTIDNSKVVSLLSPPNSSTWSLENPVIFEYMVFSPNEISNCTLTTIRDYGQANLFTGGKAYSRTESPHGMGEYAFDNNLSTFWETDFRAGQYPTRAPQWIMYDFGQGNERRITKYSLGCGPYGAGDTGRMPRDWAFQGSNDGSEWATLDSRTGQTGWSNNEFRNYSFANENSYRYYRLRVDQGIDTDILRLAELQAFGYAEASNTSTSVVRETEQAISMHLPDETFSWSISCIDSMHQSITSEARLLEVDAALPLSSSLVSPQDGHYSSENTVSFTCTAESSRELSSITLYGNWSGWHANETKEVTGKSNSTVFSKTLPDGKYSWNCLAADSEKSTFAAKNSTFRLYNGPVDLEDQTTWAGFPNIGHSTLVLNEDMTLVPKEYKLNTTFPLFVFNNSATLDCDGATITGIGLGTAVLSSRGEITIRNCAFSGFSNVFNFLEIGGISSLDSVIPSGSISGIRSIRTVMVDNEGHYVIGGSHQNPPELGRRYVAKISPEGHVVWTHLGASANDGAIDKVALDKDGNYLVAGQDSGATTSIYLFEKLDSKTGEVLWSIETASRQRISSIGVDSNGNYVIGGHWSLSTDTIWWMQKMTPGGTVLWYKELDLGGGGQAANHNRLMDLAIDQEDNIIAVGGERSGTRGWVIKFSPDGEQIWSEYFTVGMYSSLAKSVAVDQEGNYVVAGAVSRPGVQNAFTNVYKYSKHGGSPIWSWSSESLGLHSGGGYIAVDQAGNYVLAWDFKTDYFSSILNGSILYFTPEGSILGSTTWQSSGSPGSPPAATAIAIDHYGNAVVPGTSPGWSVLRATTAKVPLSGITLENVKIYDERESAGFLFSPSAEPTITGLEIGYNSSVGKIEFGPISGAGYLATDTLILRPGFVSLNETASPQFNVDANITLYSQACEAVRHYKAPGFPTTYAQIIQQGAIFTPSYSECQDGITTFSTLGGFSGYATNSTPSECVMINSPGEYLLANSLEGADNPVSGIPGASIACIIILADDVTLDCNGFSIINNGTAEAAAVLFNETSNNVTLQNCPEISGYKFGVYAYQSSGARIENNTVHSNTHNILLNHSSAEGSGNRLYNSSLYDMYLQAGAAAQSASFTGTVFDRPEGNNTDYTILSFSDSFSSSAYSISWAETPLPLPEEKLSFENKFLDISTHSGAVSISHLEWSWEESELPGYNKSRFGIWVHDGSWADAGAFLDEGANTLTATGLVPGSEYGILQDLTLQIAMTLLSPSNGSTVPTAQLDLSCHMQSEYLLQNSTLYGSWGGWHANETAPLSGLSDYHTFTKTLPEGTYEWNCLGYDSAGNPAWAPSNYTFTVNLSISNASSVYGANVTVLGTGRFQGNTTAGNITIEGGNISRSDLETIASTRRWAGFYGNVSANLLLSEHNASVYMYIWQYDSSSGGEVCASTSSNPFWGTWSPASTEAIDLAWEFPSESADSANRTLNESGSLSLAGLSQGSAAVTTAGGTAWQTVAVGNLGGTGKGQYGFCVNITGGDLAFNDREVDFQLMVPTNSSSFSYETFFFYVELH